MTQPNLTHPIGREEPHHFREGELTRKIEERTAQIPSATFLGLALGSMILSAGLVVFSKRKDLSTFVGQWAPTLLMIGIYNKLVKQQGSDPQHRPMIQEVR